MGDIVTVPLTRISPRGEGRVTAQKNSVALVTDPRQWAYSAEADFEIPGNQNDSRMMKICVEVESGVLGVGLLRDDGAAWVSRTAATEGPTAQELSLPIPTQIRRGKLIFDNWTGLGQPARGVIREINIVRTEPDEHARATLATPDSGKKQPVITVPLTRISALGEASATIRADAVTLITDSRRWAFSAEVDFDISGEENECWIVKIDVMVESGMLGVGLLRGDGKGWAVRDSTLEGPTVKELSLPIPAQVGSGKLVFDNWTESGRARAAIRTIKIVRDDTKSYFRAALADEERGDKEAAISHYKAVLALDRSHVGAIAGLGRLQFIPPEQPFLNDLKKRSPVDVCSVIIQVRNPCNYRCFYCVAKGHNNVPVELFDLERIDKAYDQIQSKVIGTEFDCGGGEPTVHPQFPELLRICSSHGAVNIVSNNSQDPARWLPKETARRIFVRSALHPESEAKLDRYLKYARYLIDAGCRFRAIYIAHPTRVARIPEYRELFSKLGIEFQPVSFIGTFEGRSYPYSHTEEEKRLIGLEEESRYWYHRIEPHTGRIRNFRGIPCIAGYHYIYITKNGEFRRCIYDEDRVLEAPLSTPEPCGVKKCGCGMWLEKLNAIEMPYVHNFYASMLGVELVPTDWMEPLAQSLGYDGSETAMTIESIRMYDALMAAYGKDEFPE